MAIKTVLVASVSYCHGGVISGPAKDGHSEAGKNIVAYLKHHKNVSVMCVASKLCHFMAV